MNILDRVKNTLVQRQLAGPENPVLLMVSGGSDSTALAYLAADLRKQGAVGPLAMLHMNHQLRGADSAADEAFVVQLAEALEIPLFIAQADIAALVEEEKGNVEAIARRERYACASDALESLCNHVGVSFEQGRVFTAHTQDDRVEAFYMRSIVGTGPGGFRSMTYQTGCLCRPLMDLSRQQLRDYLMVRRDSKQLICFDPAGNMWREDSSNECVDYFRNFVRSEIVPKAKERNPKLTETLCRTMNLIADEDDYLAQQANELRKQSVQWTSSLPGRLPEYDAGCTLLPSFGQASPVLQRRVVHTVLQDILGYDARIETASVQAVLDAFANGTPVSGYVGNIQGNLAVSSNKHGALIEPMAAFRARRKK